jgi:hypothetical protein
MHTLLWLHQAVYAPTQQQPTQPEPAAAPAGYDSALAAARVAAIAAMEPDMSGLVLVLLQRLKLQEQQ